MSTTNTPIAANIAYPNGRCPQCGHGVWDDGVCRNNDCEATDEGQCTGCGEPYPLNQLSPAGRCDGCEETYDAEGYPRKTCSCGMAWADEPGHDEGGGA